MIRRHQKGMTLVEVLVAFAILTGVSLGVLGLLSQNTRYMVSAEERLIASIAVDNLLVKDLAQRATPPPGEASGEIEIAGRSFLYRRNIIDVGAGAVLIEYQVSRSDGAQTLSRASALKVK